jgi:ABC-2 type transport system permease protein
MQGPRRFLANAWRLGRKELASLRYEPVLLFLVVYSFTFNVYSAAEDASLDVKNAALAVVDEDRSPLSRRIVTALRRPYFQEPASLSLAEIDPTMEEGRYTFVLVIPPRFHADVLAGERPALQLDVDATAVSLAGRGAGYIEAIVAEEVERHLGDETRVAAGPPVHLVARARFNPNLASRWFQGVIEVVSSVTILALLLSGAAVIREREHGTLEHLLTLPVRPAEIMVAKVWANGAVILGAALLSLQIVVRGALGVPFAGSLPLFAAGAALYLGAVTALGIFLATTARSMPQFGLLAIPVFVTMILLSGTYTPLEAMPPALQWGMKLAPSTHFTSFAKSVLFRAAGPTEVWRDVLGIALTGGAFFAGALLRFRRSIASARG